jgi:hypothetical protein
MKEVRSYGSVEKRENGTYRARTGRNDGWKTLGHYKTKEEAEKALEDYRLKHGIEIDNNVEDVVGQSSKPWAELQQDQVEINTGTVTEPITDWDSILLSFGLDPNIFTILDDKVRMSKWASSKRLENGDRDIIWLYSYRATFVRKSVPTLTDKDLDEVRKSIRKYKPVVTKSIDVPSTFVILWSDWQLYKSASGGIDGTIERIQESFNKTFNRILELKKMGRNIEQIAFVNLGDPIESCDGHYSSQLFTVQGTMRQQLLTALDLWTLGVTSMAHLAPKRKFISVLSNHGEWTRRGGKAVTSDSDSADGFLADALQRVLDKEEVIDEWHIPHDQMNMAVNLSGVDVAFTHGHKISGKELEWLRGQTLRLLRDNGVEPKLWFCGHRHHIKVDDFGMFTRFQAPSLDSDGTTDGGSKWYADSQSIWSSPGTMTLLVGKHDKKNWSDLAVL